MLRCDPFLFLRGTDLSGTLEGAGGIGGLLALSRGTQVYFYHSDGEGNIISFENTSQTLAATYRYDAFGNRISVTGVAAINPFQFSSQRNSTPGYSYLYRFYDPTTQRWLNRDPIQELGGVNLYFFAFNAPTIWVDNWGLDPDINMTQPGDHAGDNAGKYNSGPKLFSIMAHGYPKGILDQSGNPLDAKALATLIRQNKKYKHGMPVILIACQTGKGSNSLGQQLANILGVDVQAPGDFAGVNTDGTLWTGPKDANNPNILDRDKAHRGFNFFTKSP